jgi:hypothetical protein
MDYLLKLDAKVRAMWVRKSVRVQAEGGCRGGAVARDRRTAALDDDGTSWSGSIEVKATNGAGFSPIGQ